MEELNSIEDMVVDESLNDNEEIIENAPDNIEEQDNSDTTSIVEYKEIEEPCVALTIIGENRLTDAEVFIKRGFKFSFKAFFSTLALTIMNLFI